MNILAVLTTDNWISIAAAVIAFLALVVAWFFSRRADIIGQRANALQEQANQMTAQLNTLQQQANETAQRLNALQEQANATAKQLNDLTTVANENSTRLNDVTEGQAATELRAYVSETAARMFDAGHRILELTKGKPAAELTPEKRRLLDGLEVIYRGAIEQNLNAYEEACSRYRDGAIKKDRFRKNFWSEVRNLCEGKSNGTIREVLRMPPVSPYRNIWLVYEEWHNPEAG